MTGEGYLFPMPPADDMCPRVPELKATPIAFPWGTVTIWLPVAWWLNDDDMTEHGAPLLGKPTRWPFTYGKPGYAGDLIGGDRPLELDAMEGVGFAGRPIYEADLLADIMQDNALFKRLKAEKDKS